MQQSTCLDQFCATQQCSNDSSSSSDSSSSGNVSTRSALNAVISRNACSAFTNMFADCKIMVACATDTFRLTVYSRCIKSSISTTHAVVLQLHSTAMSYHTVVVEHIYIHQISLIITAVTLKSATGRTHTSLFTISSP
jgi:hypothetical protein